MNVVITWPRSRSLFSYLEECTKAVERGQQINFRVPSKPKTYKGDRCYVVHDGLVVGWNNVITVAERDDVVDPTTNEYMRPGIYIMRDPHFIGWPGLPVKVRGFQGFRYAMNVPGLV